MKYLIIGHARHGKDTVAEILNKNFGMTFDSSSLAAAKIFIFDALKEKYGYENFGACFQDRGNKRKEWHDLIVEFNKDDKTRLAKEILKNNDIYVGMRSDAELKACLAEDLFELVIGVYNPRMPEEDKESFDIDFWNSCDFVIPNIGTLEDLEKKVVNCFAFVTMEHVLPSHSQLDAIARLKATTKVVNLDTLSEDSYPELSWRDVFDIYVDGFKTGYKTKILEYADV